ncbi:MAG: metallophosphoesterase family protein [Myxococcales bacterium]
MSKRTLGGVFGLVALAVSLSACFDKDDPMIEPEVKEDGNLEYRDPEAGPIGQLPPLPFDPQPGEPGSEEPGTPGEQPGTQPGEQPTQPTQPPAGEPAILVGAGDIARCSSDGDEQTARILDRVVAQHPNAVVFAAGDLAYNDGSPTEFKNCYDPTWGRHKARTRPAPGNHEYGTKGAAGYFAYFGEQAGEAGKGYYSYELGNWHVVALNSNCSAVGGCGEGSPQLTWLKQDLAKSGKKCIAAYWHHPRFSSGSHGPNTAVTPLWKALEDAGADFVVVGHDHHYERFAPMNSRGEATPNGIREFLVGSGGTSFRTVGKTANSQVAQVGTHGVMKFTLHDDKYEWEFLPVDGKTFTDKGSAACN